MIKRLGLFLMVNLLVVASVALIISFLGFPALPLIILCFVWGFAGSLIALFLSTWLAKVTLGIQILGRDGPHSYLVEMSNRLARRAGLMEMPAVGIYQSGEMNAFATGFTRNRALIAVSSGLLMNLQPEELEGVLAHEIGHIANGDMITMALIAGVINSFVLFFSRILGFIVARAMESGDTDFRKDRPQNLRSMTILTFIFDLIFGFLALPVVHYFSRKREFRADADGAYLLGGPDKMIRALEALKRQSTTVSEGDYRKIMGRFEGLFSTHPPIALRIEALLLSQISQKT